MIHIRTHLLVSLACLLVIAACSPSSTNPVLVSPSAGTQPPEVTLAPGSPVPAPGFVPASIRMFDLVNGWGQRGSRVMHTRDGGRNWKDVSPQAGDPDQELIPAYFLNAQAAWVNYPSPDYKQGTLYRTVDSGAHWLPSSVPFGPAVLQALDSQTLFAMADRGAAAGSQAVDIYRSTDRGATWEQLYHINPQDSSGSSLPFGGDKTGMAFRDLNNGWITGVEPLDGFVYLYATQDGGATWQEQAVDLPPALSASQIFLQQIQFFSDDQGVIPTQAVIVQNNNPQNYLGAMVSPDGGQSWKINTLLASTGVFDAASASDFYVWNGASLSTSHDGGKTWKQTIPSEVPGPSPYMVQFLDPTHGWLVDDNGAEVQLYQTKDGGKTWTLIASD